MTEVSIDQFGGRGELPDALAFVPPSRSDLFVNLLRSGPTSAADLADEVDCSDATVYRCLRDLRSAGVIDNRPAIDFSNGSTSVWFVIDEDDHAPAMEAQR